MSAALGFEAWVPQAKSKLIVDQVNGILFDYSEHLPLTGRQIFYRMVAVHGFSKTENDYKRLLEKINRGRRAELIDWSAIGDDGISSRSAPGYSSTAGLIAAVQNAIEDFSITADRGQPIRVELWVEAAGMVPQAARAVDGLGVDVYSSGWFLLNHNEARRSAASRRRRRSRGRHCCAAHWRP